MFGLFALACFLLLISLLKVTSFLFFEKLFLESLDSFTYLQVCKSKVWFLGDFMRVWFSSVFMRVRSFRVFYASFISLDFMRVSSVKSLCEFLYSKFSCEYWLGFKVHASL